MRFVLANRLLDRAGGTEVHLLTMAEHLQRLGHEVCLYSPKLGPFTDHARRRGVEVVSELRELPIDCDAVLAQDALVVYDLAERYPQAFHVFRVCGDVFDFQLPPQLDGVIDLVVVLSDRYARLAAACSVKAPVLRLRVPIDSERLSQVAPIRAQPRRAVLLGNYGEHDEVIREAWGRNGIEVSRVGGTTQRYDISTALADADIVVAKGRAALDAMACGRAVYVLDVLGGDGWVTTASYAAFEADNFAGQATDRVIGVAELEGDLAEYDPRMGVTNRDLIAQYHDARNHAIEFVEAVAAHGSMDRPSAPLRELARLVALQWSWEQTVHDLQSERAEWVERIQQAEQREADTNATVAGWVERTRQAEQRAEDADAAVGRWAERAQHAELRGVDLDEAAERHRLEAEASRAQLEWMRSTRAWRLASSYWRIRNRLAGR